MTSTNDQAGFTLIELLVALTLFAILSVGFYQVMLSGVRGTETTNDVVTVSSEARMGLNRMVRETREADFLGCDTAGGGATDGSSDSGGDGDEEDEEDEGGTSGSTTTTTPCADSSTFTVNIDFNGDSLYVPKAYEVVTFSFDPDAGAVLMTAGGETGILAEGVGPIPGYDIFSYTSSRLEYDSNRDGVTTEQELDATPGIGNANGVLDGAETDYITNVTFALRVSRSDQATDFHAEAQLRNRR